MPLENPYVNIVSDQINYSPSYANNMALLNSNQTNYTNNNTQNQINNNNQIGTNNQITNISNLNQTRDITSYTYKY